MKLFVNMVYLQAFSDNGAKSKSRVISSLCKSVGTEHTQTTAYHLQGNGQVECFNHALKTMPAKLVKKNQRNWDLHIPKVLFAYRTPLHESTGYSPYQVNFGKLPNVPVDVMLDRFPLPGEGEEKEIPEFVEDMNTSLKGVYDDVKRKLNKAYQRN